jgi:hypothetical protein
MNMSEEKMSRSVADAMASRDAASVPGFDETWLAAEARYLAQKRQYRMVTAVAVSLVLMAIVIGLLPAGEQQQLPDFELAAGLMNTTLWSAPSDVLLPEYPIDIYQDLPEMPVSTDLNEGTLL